MNDMTKDVWIEFSKGIRQFIIKRVQNEFDAEDILQDVFYKIHSNLHQLEDMKKLPAWVYQITRNAIIDYYRTRKITLEIPELYECMDDVKVTGNINKEIIPCLKPMINHLPEKYRQAIMLVYVEGLTQKEIAGKLGLSFSGAKSRVQRAREKLREMLLECCHFEFDRRGNVIEYQHRKNKYCNCDTK